MNVFSSSNVRLSSAALIVLCLATSWYFAFSLSSRAGVGT